ncbi:uncharacterized protein UTRI_03488 [Ustilago trichophora]|uniref:Uncharacterized protein n=1 Tax=Ustilago trichophora TaxID=86804 RepID=A0A5C3E2B5_9BASI|nr:uncharacterized protein UTRI_03488 [Ustilago trichophora]
MFETRSGMLIRVARRVQIWSAQTASQLSRGSGSDACTRPLSSLVCWSPMYSSSLCEDDDHPHHKFCDEQEDLRGEEERRGGGAGTSVCESFVILAKRSASSDASGRRSLLAQVHTQSCVEIVLD